ncbi:MAG: DNA mismatch repair protein MutS [Bacteroidota bacterium]
MQVDKTTLTDLSIFLNDEEQSVFHHFNFTQTNGGREYFKYILGNPLDSVKAIQDAQLTIQALMQVHEKWPLDLITNGTIMMIEKFYETAIDPYPKQPDIVTSAIYKILHSSDYSITKYTITHAISFLKGMRQILNLIDAEKKSAQLQIWYDQIEHFVEKPILKEIEKIDKDEKLSPKEILYYGNYLRSHFKRSIFDLIDIFCKLDAYMSMAIACKKYGFVFPSIEDSAQPFVNAKGLYHLLLPTPVAYDINLNKTENFIFLTGANMGGKSTYIKAIGLSVYLAHVGMGVPAKNMQLSLFDGLLSNIQVEDNIFKGQSYFYNEVQRIKKTIEKISDGKNWFILIDELFKGTNIQDAMKCSTAVIEGLIKMKHSLFVLSTHLYEIGEGLKQYPNIQFRYFETNMSEEKIEFSYHIKEGISNDRIGYLILKREGVTKLLEDL